MKIRTDFVTNSSSSSFITIIAEMLDGSIAFAEANLDDFGHGTDPMALVFMRNEDIERLFKDAANGKALIDALDSHYHGMFRGDDLSEIEQIESFESVSVIKIEDKWSGDYGKQTKRFAYDPSTKKAKTIKKL